MRKLILLLGVFALLTSAYAATYYLDAVKGNDSNPGTAAAPWKSMNKAKIAAKAGDTVLIRPGNYGSVTFVSSNSGNATAGPIVYKGDPATVTPRPSDWYEKPFASAGPTKRPEWGGITLSQGCRYLEFEDIDLVGGGGVFSKNVAYNIKIRKLNIFGVWAATASEVRPNHAVYFKDEVNITELDFHDILVEDCYSEKTGRGMSFSGAKGSIIFRHNHLYYLAGQGIGVYTINTGPVLVEGNHIHHYVQLNESPTVAKGTHMTGIALWRGTSQRVEVRGNIIHDCGNTSPITTYSCFHDKADYYSNVLVENNLVYDPHNVYMVRLHCSSGSNFVVRNNTFVGKINPDKATTYGAYGTAMLSNHKFYNNIVVGNAAGPSTNAKGNIIYYDHTKSYNTSTNRIIYGGSGPAPGIFSQSGRFFIGSGDFTLAAKHGRNLTNAFKLAPGSAAIDYGDPANAPATDLLGNPRNDGKPDAGCFEYSATGIPDFVRKPAEITRKQDQAGMAIYSIAGKYIGSAGIMAGKLAPGVYLVLGSGLEKQQAEKIVVLK